MSSERMSSGYDRRERMASPPSRNHGDYNNNRPYSRTGVNYDSRQPIRPDNGSYLYARFIEKEKIKFVSNFS